MDNHKDLRITKDDITAELTTTFLQELNETKNISTINLGTCKDILKYHYNIPEERDLYILKIEKEQEGKNYPIVEYEVFYLINNEKRGIADLNLCNVTDIEISFPFLINENSIDKYNPKSGYYTDICYKATSDSYTDIPVTDRRDEFIKKNLSLCEEICEFESYDVINNRVKCLCNMKFEIYLDDNYNLRPKKNLFREFFDFQKIINIGIVKCYKNVFKINNYRNNYGLIIILFIFLLYLICMNIFYCKSLKNLTDEITYIILAKNHKKTEIVKSKEISIFDFDNIKNRRNAKKQIKIEKGSSFQIIKISSLILSKKIEKEEEKRKETIKEKIKEKIIERTRNALNYIDSEINFLSYKEALKKDKRTYIQFYCSLLKKKNSILFSFYPNKDYNSQIIKIFLFFFYYASDITINALFFNDDAIHNIYINEGAFNFLYQLPKTLYSFLISSIINLIVQYLSLTEYTIISFKMQTKNISKVAKKTKNCMILKFFFFFLTTLILLLISLFYISCFCYVYENTQMHLIKDSLISLGISLIFPIFISLIPGLFRIPALSSNKGNRICMYNFSKFIENIF